MCTYIYIYNISIHKLFGRWFQNVSANFVTICCDRQKRTHPGRVFIRMIPTKEKRSWNGLTPSDPTEFLLMK